MSIEQTTPRDEPPPDVEQENATAAEAQEALEALSDTDLAKLMSIAEWFWRRRLRGSKAAWVGPEDLLQEAMLRTLNGAKKWSKTVPFVKHLDRAMENLSGHALGKEGRLPRVREPLDELEVEGALLDSRQGAGADERLVAREELREVEAMFAADDDAWNLLSRQATGMKASEIRDELGMSKTQYATVRRRIRRRFLDRRMDTKG